MVTPISSASPFASGRSAWSLGAFALATLGVGASVIAILGSDGDSSQVVWAIVVAPVVLTLVPLLVRQHGVVRLGALLLLGLWCAVTGFTVGVLLLPALFAAFMAVPREP
jgi:hypothetical protein